jgi:hypothetical protein
MHNVPYAQEPQTLAKMDSLMSESDLEPNGLHHEIYLSNVSETDRAKMHTILRQPVRRAAATRLTAFMHANVGCCDRTVGTSQMCCR